MLLGLWHLKNGSKSMQSSLILRQRPQIHVNCKIFYDFCYILKMGKQSDFHLSLFSRDFTGVTELTKKKGVKRFWRFSEHLFWTFRLFTRKNKNCKTKRNLKSICVNHQSERGYDQKILLEAKNDQETASWKRGICHRKRGTCHCSMH